jgi:hypothetical protein
MVKIIDNSKELDAFIFRKNKSASLGEGNPKTMIQEFLYPIFGRNGYFINCAMWGTKLSTKMTIS